MTTPLSTQCLSCQETGIQLAKLLLQSGEVVGVPTETVYGLAADATNPEAVQRIYAAKGRPAHNPLIVHLPASWGNLTKLIDLGFVDGLRLGKQERELAASLMQKFWPGPLTLILPRGPALPASVAAGLPTLGFRVPQHEGFLRLLESCQLPLAAPSANLSNRISPTEAAHVLAELSGRIPLVLDGGVARVGLESTIVAIEEGGALRILRFGGLSPEDLNRAGGQLLYSPEPEAIRRIEAPGMMAEHYAPRKPTFLLEGGDSETIGKRICAVVPLKELAVLSFGQATRLPQSLLDLKFTLLRRELPIESKAAAQLLFKTLRECDQSSVDAIVVVLPEDSDHELWPAIKDRLTRASARWRQAKP